MKFSSPLLGKNLLLKKRLILIFAALLLIVFSKIIPTNFKPEKWMTYRNFDVPKEKNFINYMLPGIKDSSSNLFYSFKEIHYPVLLGVLFGFFPVMFILRIIFDVDFKLKVYRYFTQWLTFVVARLGIFRVTGACPVKRSGLGVFPFINCQSCELATGACPIGTFQMSMLNREIPFMLVGQIMLVGVLSGRWVCGWLCPFGFLSDIFGKIKAKKIKVSNKFSIMKYFVLLLIIGSGIYYYNNKSDFLLYCSFICPAGFYYGVLEYALTTGLKSMTSRFPFLHFMLLYHFLTGLVFLIGAIKIGGRFYCRMFCPLGALLGIFNRIAVFKVQTNENRCTGCGACSKVCPMDISILSKSFLSQSNCISCGRCVKVCPTKKLEFSIDLGKGGKQKVLEKNYANLKN